MTTLGAIIRPPVESLLSISDSSRTDNHTNDCRTSLGVFIKTSDLLLELSTLPSTRNPTSCITTAPTTSLGVLRTSDPSLDEPFDPTPPVTESSKLVPKKGQCSAHKELQRSPPNTPRRPQRRSPRTVQVWTKSDQNWPNPVNITGPIRTCCRPLSPRADHKTPRA